MPFMTAKKRTAGKTRGGKHSSPLTTREQKRSVGYELLRQGCTKAQVAKVVGVSWVTTNRWTKQLQAKKARTHDKKRSGRPEKLTHSQHTKLKRILKNGAQHYGYPTELWTLKRVTDVINKEFGVKYNTTHVWRVLRSMGFSAQVPLLRAIERDEEYISWWIKEKWPEIQLLAQKEDAELLFIDESCIQCQPNVKRTWAPKGSRPEIRVKQGSRDKLSIISAVKVDGELFFGVHGHNLEGADVVRFLRKLSKEMRKQKLLVVWDNIGIHRSKLVARFLERNKSLFIARRFPPYAPDLNPDESVWNLAKNHDLANWCPSSGKEMRRVITKELKMLPCKRTG
jgi:transposase